MSDKPHGPVGDREMQRMYGAKYPADQTHYDGCWHDLKHHVCAVREIERLRAEVVETTRRAGRLASLLRDARADVKELADQQTKRHRIEQYKQQLAEIDEALEPK